MSKNMPGYVSLTVHELGIIEYVAGEAAPRPSKFKGQQGGGKNNRRGGGKRRGVGRGGDRHDFGGPMNHGGGHSGEPRPFRLPRPAFKSDSAPPAGSPQNSDDIAASEG